MKGMMLLAAFFGIVAGQEGSLAASSPESKPFSRLIQPTGWSVPQHGKVLSTGAYRPSPQFPAGITITEFAVDPAMTTLLPWYYIQRSDLILQVLPFRIEKLKRIEVGGRPVAYIAAVKGTGWRRCGSVVDGRRWERSLHCVPLGHPDSGTCGVASPPGGTRFVIGFFASREPSGIGSEMQVQQEIDLQLLVLARYLSTDLGRFLSVDPRYDA